MTTEPSTANEAIECPLCLGEGTLKRTEILDRLGVKDFARVAQLSAEEAFRLLQQKHHHDEQNVWARFETELTKRTAEIEQRYRDELRTVGGRIKELESAARVAERTARASNCSVTVMRTPEEAKLPRSAVRKSKTSRAESKIALEKYPNFVSATSIWKPRWRR